MIHTALAPPLIIGTSSPFRLSLFRTHFPDLRYTTAKPAIDEKRILPPSGIRDTANPAKLALSIAHAKSDALAHLMRNDEILVTFDQVVTYNGNAREKPETEEICRQYLRSYESYPLVTVSAVVVAGKSKRVDGLDVAKQYFTRIDEHVIDQLIQKGDVMWCAGGITVEDELLDPYKLDREGSLESIMGLPVDLLRQLLHDMGVSSGMHQVQPVQAQPVQAQLMQGQPEQGQPIQGHPVKGKPVQGQPIWYGGQFQGRNDSQGPY